MTITDIYHSIKNRIRLNTRRNGVFHLKFMDLSVTKKNSLMT